MVLSFTTNMFIGFLDSTETLVSKKIGVALLICGFLIFTYALLYLRSGFFGETEPKLDFLVTKGPYRFCRHPQYLSFIIMILGIDLMFRSVTGILFTLVLSIPSVVYRAKIEDKVLRKNSAKNGRTTRIKSGSCFQSRVKFFLKKLKIRSPKPYQFVGWEYLYNKLGIFTSSLLVVRSRR